MAAWNPQASHSGLDDGEEVTSSMLSEPSKASDADMVEHGMMHSTLARASSNSSSESSSSSVLELSHQQQQQQTLSAFTFLGPLCIAV